MRLFLIVLGVVFFSTSKAQQEKKDSTLYGYVDSLKFRKTSLPPFYLGGDAAWQQYLDKNLVYPPKARRKKVSGVVVIEFTVDPEGATSNYSVYQSVYPLLDEEALRLVKESGEWKSAMQGRHRVFYRNRVSIPFTLKH